METDERPKIQVPFGKWSSHHAFYVKSPVRIRYGIMAL